MTVTIPFDPFWEPLHWAKKYCPSYITNDMHMDTIHMMLQRLIIILVMKKMQFGLC